MRFRQVHLDFHTSGNIPGIGARFDKKQFQKALIDGHVDSITVFSKCHHGWAYHPSTANTPHPHLTMDLLGAQLEACREIGVNAPVYISAGYDEKEVLLHPEWLNVNPDHAETSTFTKARYHLFCYNTPYLDKLVKQVEEVMEKYNPVGIFMDISNEHRCVCASCVRSMMEKGLDPENMDDVRAHGRDVYKNYALRIEEAVRKYSKTATIFHNAGHITHGRRDVAHYNTHLELESLPTGGWGYDHFPLSAAYARTLGMEFLGMTGKFHTSWGEFGGFKHPNALIYETGLSLSQGACISIGDQLHPSGEMNLSTYSLIGKAYELVEKKQPFCEGYKNISDIAVLSVEAARQTGRNGAGTDSNVGANRILLEGKYLFDFIDLESDFAPYKLLILPDLIRINGALKEKIDAFLQNGGKLLLTGESGLWEDRDEFAFDTGCAFAGVNEYRPDYMIPCTASVNGETTYVMYARGMTIDSVTGEVIARRQNPYFNRAWNHFSSHRHTPNDVSAPEMPAAVVNGSIAYIGWDIFDDYRNLGELHAKELVLCAIEKLIADEKSIKTTLPDRGVITLTEKENKKVVHLLFTATTNRGKGIEIIEDAIPLYDVKVSAACAKKPERVYLAPENTDIPFTWDGKEVHFTVPKVVLHQMIAIE